MQHGIDFRQSVEQLCKIGLALSSQQDLNVLLEMIVDQSRAFTSADAGTLYIVRPDKKDLNFEVIQNDTFNVRMGGTAEARVTFPPVALSVDGQANMSNVSAYVANTGEIVNIPDVYEAEGFDFTGPRRYDQQSGYRSKSMLVIPMKNHEDEIIGVLQLINAQIPNTKEIIAFAPELVELAEPLASMAAVTISNVRLIRDLENLFEAFIKTIAAGIDEKSKYTGGHIRRVTELTVAIARQINKTQEGPLGYVEMTPEEMNELRTAAWMHDVGKITTPEYVVDKACKLETIFDRIELVRTRFELAQREVELDSLRRQVDLLKSGRIEDERITKIEREAVEKAEAIQADFDFLEQCNKGGEFMADEKIAKLKEIASGTVKLRGDTMPLLTEDEVYNMSIRKGTLTSEEMNIMRNHAAVSIKMLSQLPFSRKLRKVPGYAGGHHECLNGKGYPQGLTADSLPLQGADYGNRRYFRGPHGARPALQKGDALVGRPKNPSKHGGGGPPRCGHRRAMFEGRCPFGLCQAGVESRTDRSELNAPPDGSSLPAATQTSSHRIPASIVFGSSQNHPANDHLLPLTSFHMEVGSTPGWDRNALINNRKAKFRFQGSNSEANLTCCHPRTLLKFLEAVASGNRLL